MEPPEISVSMSRDGDSWVIDVSVVGVDQDRISVEDRRYGAEIRVTDPVGAQ
jgi:hypothetical protein